VLPLAQRATFIFLIAEEGKERAAGLAHYLQVTGRIPEVAFNQAGRTHNSQALAKEGWTTPGQAGGVIVAKIMHQTTAGRGHHEFEVPRSSKPPLNQRGYTGSTVGKEAGAIPNQCSGIPEEGIQRVSGAGHNFQIAG